MQTTTEGTSNPEVTETEGVQQTEQTDSVMAEAPAPAQVIAYCLILSYFGSHVIYKVRNRGLVMCERSPKGY